MRLGGLYLERLIRGGAYFRIFQYPYRITVRVFSVIGQVKKSNISTCIKPKFNDPVLISMAALDALEIFAL